MRIPKVLHLTYFSSEVVPRYIWEGFERAADDEYEIKFYDDAACIDFIRREYDDKLASIFQVMPDGAHKADLFRYCLLYKVGGVYLDIKIIPFAKLAELFPDRPEGVLYTCLSVIKNYIFQAILATHPFNPIFPPLIDDFRKPESHRQVRSDRAFFCRRFRHLLNLAATDRVEVGHNTLKDGTSVVLLQEEARRMPGDEKVDRYGGFYNVFDQHGRRVFRSRDPAFPWRLNNR
jgi:hypothetical protein